MIWQLLSETIYARDENLNEITRKMPMMKSKRKVIPILESDGVFEHVSQFSLPTSFGTFYGVYVLVNRVTGQLLRIQSAPLLLSTRHDPDMTCSESRLYRGDQMERWTGVGRIGAMVEQIRLQDSSQPRIDKTDVDVYAGADCRQTAESLKQNDDFQDEEESTKQTSFSYSFPSSSSSLTTFGEEPVSRINGTD